MKRIKSTTLSFCILLGLLIPALSLSAAWEVVDIPGQSQRPQDMIVFNGTLIAVGYDGEIITSTDGQTWTLQSVAVDPISASDSALPAFRAITATDTLIMAVGDSGVVATSPNGTDWTVTRQASLDLQGMYSIATNGSLFFAPNLTDKVQISDDGITWTESASVPDETIVRNIVYTGEEFVVIPQSGNFAFITVDGLTWNTIESGLIDFLFIEGFSIAGEGVYAGGQTAQGPGLAVATDPSGFDRATLEGQSDTGFMKDTVLADGLYVAVGGNFATPSVGYVFTSTNGSSFSLEFAELPHVANAVVDLNDRWVIVGEGYAAYNDNLDQPTEPYLIEGAVDFGDGWYDSWIGTINVNNWPWVYSTVGWFFAGNTGNTNTDSWFYFNNSQLQCWVYASENIESWVYMQPIGQSEGWWFVNGEAVEGFTYFFGPNNANVGIADEF